MNEGDYIMRVCGTVIVLLTCYGLFSFMSYERGFFFFIIHHFVLLISKINPYLKKGLKKAIIQGHK